MPDPAAPDTALPLVSVVTPAYQAEAYLRLNLESVRAQDYARIEHIVVDGGSTDGTVKLLEEQPGVRWISEKDSGQSEALNKGFRLAGGEIFGWLNADDTYCPGAVSTAVAFLSAHPDVDLVYSDVNVIDLDGYSLRLGKSAPFTIESHLFKNAIMQPSVFMRRQVIQSLEGVREDLHYVMDQELWLRAGLRFKPVYLPGAILANFRYFPGTKSREHAPDFHKEWAGVLQELENSGQVDPSLRKHIRRARRAAWKQHYFSRMVQAAEEGRAGEAAACFGRGLACDWSGLLRPGVWKLAGRVALGRPPSNREAAR